MTLVIVFILNFNLFRPLLRLHSNLSSGLLSHQLSGIHMMVVVTLNESGQYYAHTETSQLIYIAKSIDWFLYENNNELIWDKYVLIFGWHFKVILHVGFGRMFLKIYTQALILTCVYRSTSLPEMACQNLRFIL